MDDDDDPVAATGAPVRRPAVPRVHVLPPGAVDGGSRRPDVAVGRGLTSAEIARAFLVEERTMVQRLFRAKRKIKDAAIPFRVPPPERMAERLDDVLAVLYLLFNEGYRPTGGADADRVDVAAEAIRLAQLARRPVARRTRGRRPARPDGAARRPPCCRGSTTVATSSPSTSRTAPGGTTSGSRGPPHALDAAVARGRPGPYQLQAAIAACHATARACRGHRLAADRRALRSPGRALPGPDRRAQPSGRRGHGRRRRRRPRHRRRGRRVRPARRVPPPAGDARRPAAPSRSHATTRQRRTARPSPSPPTRPTCASSPPGCGRSRPDDRARDRRRQPAPGGASSGAPVPLAGPAGGASGAVADRRGRLGGRSRPGSAGRPPRPHGRLAGRSTSAAAAWATAYCWFAACWRAYAAAAACWAATSLAWRSAAAWRASWSASARSRAVSRSSRCKRWVIHRSRRVDEERGDEVADRREQQRHVEHRIAGQLVGREDPPERAHRPVDAALDPLDEAGVRVGAAEAEEERQQQHDRRDEHEGPHDPHQDLGRSCSNVGIGDDSAASALRSDASAIDSVEGMFMPSRFADG